MNIEDLTKSQLLLLTILVNFIVSIATGVLVVSMLDQAPQPVQQTVQQIVDHTIETVTTPIAPATPSKPVPATPTEEQKLTSAIAADGARTVLIYHGATTTPALAFGVYLPKSHAVATVFTYALPKEATIEFADGSTLDASLSKTGATMAIYGFADNATLPQAPATNPVAAANLKQGQTVVGLTKDHVAVTGIISKVEDTTDILTTLANIPVGAGITDLSGNLVGVSAGDGTFYPTDKIMTLLETPAASSS